MCIIRAARNRPDSMTPRIQPTIELVYDRDCPNVGSCRGVLRSALVQLGVSQSWSEWDRSASDTPAVYRHFGSPTILVNGRDIAAQAGAEHAGNSCRVYADESGALTGTPSVELVLKALSMCST